MRGFEMVGFVAGWDLGGWVVGLGVWVFVWGKGGRERVLVLLSFAGFVVIFSFFC
jgi:hypothetical protein